MTARTLAIAALLAGCTSDGGSPPDTFLAFSPAFAPFRTWTSFHSDGPPDDGTFPGEALGARTLYINELPSSGTTEFPVGTIIVEARETGAMNLFAKAKRGGGYNLGGAMNWEWFELTENPVAIVWRGLGPPNGESYGGDPNACNTCHATCGAGNDFACTSTIRLSSF
jgi:hypothetical protein